MRTFPWYLIGVVCAVIVSGAVLTSGCIGKGSAWIRMPGLEAGGEWDATTNGQQQVMNLGESEGGPNLAFSNIDISVEYDGGAVLDAMDDHDTLAYVAFLPIQLSSGNVEELWEAYPGLRSIDTGTKHTELTFEGTAIEGLTLLGDLGFRAVYLDIRNATKEEVELLGGVADITGDVIRIGTGEMQQQVRTLTYNGYSLQQVTARTARAKAQ